MAFVPVTIQHNLNYITPFGAHHYFSSCLQARVSMYVGREEVMFTTFNATDTNTTSWMSPHTILDSKYTNIGQAETSDISVNG